MIGVGPEDGLTLPNFKAIGQAFGISSDVASSIEDWEGSEIQRLMSNGESALIEVLLDTEQSFAPKLASRKLADGTMVSPSLEDMAPFLSREELQENILKS